MRAARSRPDDLAFPDRDCMALWSDLSLDGEPPEVEAPVSMEWATEEEAATLAKVEGMAALAEVDRVMMKRKKRCYSLRVTYPMHMRGVVHICTSAI
jgi:hypothetical protein